MRCWFRELGSACACAFVLGLGAYSGCVLYVPTDEFRRERATDADASPPTEGGESTYRDLVLRDAPIAYWRFEDAPGGIAHDETGNGHDATYVGSFTSAPGALTTENDKAIEFDGRSAYLLVADAAPFAFSGTAACSFEAWVKTRPSQIAYRKIFMQAERAANGNPTAGWILSIKTTDRGSEIEYDRLRASNSDGITAGAVPEDTWTHVVLTYKSGADATLYIDGTRVGSKSLSMSLDPNSAAFVIGGNTDPNEPSYSGQMDELAVYDHELTATQVRAHFQTARGNAP